MKLPRALFCVEELAEFLWIQSSDTKSMHPVNSGSAPGTIGRVPRIIGRVPRTIYWATAIIGWVPGTIARDPGNSSECLWVHLPGMSDISYMSHQSRKWLHEW
jgi:hypothetical protein